MAGKTEPSGMKGAKPSQLSEIKGVENRFIAMVNKNGLGLVLREVKSSIYTDSAKVIFEKSNLSPAEKEVGFVADSLRKFDELPFVVDVFEKRLAKVAADYGKTREVVRVAYNLSSDEVLDCLTHYKRMQTVCERIAHNMGLETYQMRKNIEAVDNLARSFTAPEVISVISELKERSGKGRNSDIADKDMIHIVDNFYKISINSGKEGAVAVAHCISNFIGGEDAAANMTRIMDILESLTDVARDSEDYVIVASKHVENSKDIIEAVKTAQEIAQGKYKGTSEKGEGA